MCDEKAVTRPFRFQGVAGEVLSTGPTISQAAQYSVYRRTVRREARFVTSINSNGHADPHDAEPSRGLFRYVSRNRQHQLMTFAMED